LGRGWRADYGDDQNGLPHAIHLTSLEHDGRSGSDFDLRLGLSQVDLNAPLDASIFTLQIPRGAGPITLDELRKSGPFGSTSVHAR
jgi:hypothetical protein